MSWVKETALTDQRCPRCSANVRVSWVGGVCAAIDPQPITPAEEAAEILAHRPTWRVVAGELADRTADHIRRGEPGYRLHTCRRTQ